MSYEPTAEDFVRGYWFYRPSEEFPPAPIFYLDKAFSGLKLSLAGIPQTSDLTDYQIRKTIRGWAEILPTLSSVELLWVSPKTNQALFDAIGCMPNLRGLYLKHTSIESIPTKAFRGLRFLNLGSSPRLESIEPLSSITSLEWLETENLKRITDFSPLSKLTSLKGLGIDGDMWTTQRVNSLSPLTTLQRLRFLSLTNTRVADKSLKPLHGLHDLLTFRAAKWWSATEISALRDALPKLNVI